MFNSDGEVGFLYLLLTPTALPTPVEYPAPASAELKLDRFRMLLALVYQI